MNKISKKHIFVIVLLVVLGAGLVFGLIAGFNALQTKMDRTRVEVLSRTVSDRRITPAWGSK